MNEDIKTVLSVTDSLYLIKPKYYDEWILYLNNIDDEISLKFLQQLLNGLLLVEIASFSKLKPFYQKEGLSIEIIDLLLEQVKHFSNKIIDNNLKIK